MIVIVFGLPGSGKSYFAERLAKMIGAEYVNSDRLRREMFSKRTYTPEEKNAVYIAMRAKMKIAVSQKKSIVLDATFHRAKTRAPFISDAGHEKIVFMEVKTDEKIVRDRLNHVRPDSEADFEIYQLIKNQWEPLKGERLLLESTNDNIEDMLQKAAVYLHQYDDN
jgi:predicted kinase